MFDLISLIKAAGYFGVFGIVFAESGLLIGFFFPGDSLLFTAGFLASQGFLNIWVLALGSFICAVAGDGVGYAFGRRVGPAIFKRENSFWFHKDHLERAHRFYEAHGGKTIILARFMPIVRTFAPIIAGVGVMRYSTFFMYNVIGGALWAIGMSMLGFFLGSVVPNIDRYLLPIIVGIIFLSVLPSIIHILRDKTMRAQLRASISHCLNKIKK
ncbi:VTT domain-containing protein [Candidatus Uhrbacteria bacterium]|nr:VTT domain-containing protein [Candidatus Uhrbacteria bacterium]